MPTNLPPRRTNKPLSKTVKCILLVAAAMLIIVARTYAGDFLQADYRTPLEEQFMQHLDTMHKYQMQAVENPETRLGYYGFEHNRYHAPFYSHMNTMDGHNCCSGEECRPTEVLIEAPPEFKNDGFDKMVFVDGDWYPVKMKEVQVSFDAKQLALAKQSTLYQEFLQQTHVCARRMYVTEQMRSDKKRYHDYLVAQSRGIYCILEGGVKM